MIDPKGAVQATSPGRRVQCNYQSLPAPGTPRNAQLQSDVREADEACGEVPAAAWSTAMRLLNPPSDDTRSSSCTVGIHPLEYKGAYGRLWRFAACRSRRASFRLGWRQTLAAPARSPLTEASAGRAWRADCRGPMGTCRCLCIDAPATGAHRRDRPWPTGLRARRRSAIVIEVSGGSQPGSAFKQSPSDIPALSREEIVQAVKDAGLVCLGGAAFPVYVKLAAPPDKPDTYAVDQWLVSASPT